MNESLKTFEDRYIIMKRTRAVSSPTVDFAYRNPDTCKCAGVDPGKVYTNFDEAKKDSDKLTGCNGVGFVVIRLKD
jgi:hypothetical protein